MMMQMLAAGGIDVVTDHLRQADTDNPRGYFEYEPVKALAETNDTSWLDTAHGKAVKIISSLLTYLPEDKIYNIIFMERNLQEVLASQTRMLEHLDKLVNPEGDDAMTASFTRHLGQIKAWLRQQSHIDVLYLRYADVVAEPEAAIQRIQAFLDQPLLSAAMRAEVDPTLHRNRTSPESS